MRPSFRSTALPDGLCGHPSPDAYTLECVALAAFLPLLDTPPGMLLQ